jgi:hypothetical protein
MSTAGWAVAYVMNQVLWDDAYTRCLNILFAAYQPHTTP